MENNKVVTSDGTTLMDITDTTASPSDVAAGEVFYAANGVRSVGTGNYMSKVSNPTADNILVTDANGQAQDSGVAITDKQDTLVSGTNIKTVNGTSLLGSGDVDTSEVFVAVKGHTTLAEIKDANTAGKKFLLNINGMIVTPAIVNVQNSSAMFVCYAIDENGYMAPYFVLYAVMSSGWTTVQDSYLQAQLTSGTNIKTINNQSLLGSGNIDIQGGGTVDQTYDATSTNAQSGTAVAEAVAGAQDVFVAVKGVTSFADLAAACDADKVVLYRSSSSSIKTIPCIYDVYENQIDLYHMTGTRNAMCVRQKSDDTWVTVADNALVTKNDVATDAEYGIVKVNPSKSVTLNANGQIEVGGRLGAFNGTTGIFHSDDREPRRVDDFSLLITDAKGMNLAAPRDFALVTGVNLSLKGSHAAGSTTYQVSNTYANRIACYVLKNGGYVGQNETWCKQNQIVPVSSVTIGGSANWTPDSSADSSANNIVITVEQTANPDSAVSQLRVFGGITGGYCSEYIGQCVGGQLGASLEIGQRVYSTANVNCIVAADVWNSGNGNAIFGRLHISRKNRWFIAGSGHDTTNGRSEAGAVVGQYANITANTMFAVGNGTSHTARSNAFEVTDDGGIIVPSSTSGSTKKFKITVDDSGTISATDV